MDKLERQLREDAQRIEARVSDELDARIGASLRAVTPQAPANARLRAGRPALFWWASSLTGAAAALAVIAIVNLQPPTAPVETPPPAMAAVPVVDWQAETAALTNPLQKELENLQSDLKKAEKKLRDDVGL